MTTNSNIMTPEFRVSFPNVFRPAKPMNPTQEAKYSVVMLFPPGADLSALKAAASAAVIDKWGADQSKWPPKLKSPFRDQGEKTQEGYVKGAVFVTITSKQRPGLVDASVQPIIDETQFYAGCYARASIRAFTYDASGNRGVSFGLQNIQKTRDGESLSGRVNAEKEFAPVAGTGGQVSDASSIFDT